MKIGSKLTVVLIAISIISISAVGGSLLFQSRTMISGLSRDYALSVARESAMEIKNYKEDDFVRPPFYTDTVQAMIIIGESYGSKI